MNLNRRVGREPVWTQSLAVGHKDYVKGVKLAPGLAGSDDSSAKSGNDSINTVPIMTL